MINNKINVFEMVARINDDFGNQVYIARSFPSIDVKLTCDKNCDIIKIHTYCEDEPECTQGYLTISWKRDDKDENPFYHFVYHLEQTSDGETTKWDEMDFVSPDIREVVRMLLIVMVGEDEPSHDEDPSSWSTGMYPDEYFDDCYNNWKGIFKDLQGKILSNMWS